jgi:hypothetical protein
MRAMIRPVGYVQAHESRASSVLDVRVAPSVRLGSLAVGAASLFLLALVGTTALSKVDAANGLGITGATCNIDAAWQPSLPPGTKGCQTYCSLAWPGFLPSAWAWGAAAVSLNCRDRYQAVTRQQ